jgi:hypothetical protein
MPSNIYKAYLKEDEVYDLYCGPLLIAIGIKESDLYSLISLLKGVMLSH